MALLTDTDRARAMAGLMRDASHASGNFTKADLRAALDATDSWIDGNATSYNAALPQPFKGQASLTEKTLLLCYVAMRRAGLLHVAEDD